MEDLLLKRTAGNVMHKSLQTWFIYRKEKKINSQRTKYKLF